MSSVQFAYVGELIRKPLDTLDRLKTLVDKFSSLLELYEEFCDDNVEREQLRSELNKSQDVLAHAQKLLEPSGLSKSSEIPDDSENIIHNAPMDTKAAIEFANWNVKALKLLTKTENFVTVLEDKTKNQSEVEAKLLARKIKRESRLLTTTPKKLEIYKMSGIESYAEKDGRYRRVSIGTEMLDSYFKQTKVIMTVGMTGSGKTTMVNAFINYLYGVEYRDSFRFELVTSDEELSERGGDTTTKALSMTSWVTGYELKWQPGFRFDANILLIDTPGFADPRGLYRDNEIVNSIQQFFENEKACFIDAIASVAFIMPSNVTKLTSEQKYCIDKILQLFGKDLSQNMSLLFTFADNTDPPPAHETVKYDEIPFVDYYLVNNCSLFSEKELLNEIFWNKNLEMIKKYFKNLEKIQPTDLNLTRTVLKERDTLTAVLEDLKRRIDDTMVLLRNIESCIDAVLSLDESSFNLQTELTFKTYRKVLETVRYYCMNCKTCERTCHTGCRAITNYWCTVFDKTQKCQNCDEKCHKNEHVKENKIYKTITTETTANVEKLLREYNIQKDDPYAERKLLSDILERYRIQKTFLLNNIFTATVIMRKLDRIALRNSFFTHEEYIKHLIQREIQVCSRSEGEKLHRIEMLEQLLEVVRLASYMRLCYENTSFCIRTESEIDGEFFNKNCVYFVVFIFASEKFESTVFPAFSSSYLTDS